MKIKRLAHFRPALLALGVFLGRGAQADTILDFNVVPVGQVNNGPPGIQQWFGDYAAASSDGVTVSGFGTPNIGVTWQATDASNIPTSSEARWDYYNDMATYNVWGGVGQLNDSAVGNSHSVVFAPNNSSARVVVKSFNFFPYYVSSERFTYNVTVLAGATVVSGPTPITFLSDATKNHPVSINYTGAPGQTLKLRITREASTLGAGEIEGGGYNIAVDDIRFAQLPETTFPAGPQVVAVSPADDTAGVPGVYYPYSASITNGDTLLVAGSIHLKLDGTLVSPPPVISTDGSVTNVSYQGTSLLTSGPHRYTLTYADNVGSFYTNEVQFSVTYATLPSAYALPPSAGVVRGFTFRTVSANSEAAYLDSTIARAVAQLNGTLIDTNTSLPYTNSATLGTNADGSFSIDTVLNFVDNGPAGGNFPGDTPFPGLDAPPDNWFSSEALLYLDLPAGYYRFGVNSDDGFAVNALPPQGLPGSPVLLGIFDGGRGPSDTWFDVLVPASGIYPFQLIYFQSDGWSGCEFFSVTNLATGDKVLVNDTSDVNAIKSYRVLAPRITSIVRSGSNVVIQWAYGTPPFQVQFKNNLANPTWNNIGSPTSSRTATIPLAPGAGFIRVYGQ